MSLCAVWGAPQSGKTTLTVNLAYAVSQGEKSVCLISPTSYSELSAFLGINIPEKQSLYAALRGGEGIRQCVFKVDELLYILAAPVTSDAFNGGDYTGEQVKALLEVAESTFDAVIVDCPSDLSNLFSAWTLNRADIVILNTGGRSACVMWYAANKKALQAIEHKAVRVSSEVTSDFDYDAMYQLLGCMPDIRVPYVREAALLQNESNYLYELPGKKGWAYARAINQLYEVITL
ncbi:MAG: cobalamin biosynthesis protein CobQ [Oscillospiraceae bacterium]|nr:cobalamin biosynthesis protein CobQ [Oscillospiraceae bacterium]